jgi:peptidoglycan-associated lipoprotein
MKHLSIAGKVVTLLFATTLMVACSSNESKDDAATGSDTMTTTTDSAAQSAAEREMQRLQDAAARAGNVFYFEFDSAALTRQAIAALDAHIAVLQRTDRNVRLEGHTDERGTREYNIALGERRANSVRDYMVANGIGSYRIESVSYGEERPVAYGSSESSWSQNRRVELK